MTLEEHYKLYAEYLRDLVNRGDTIVSEGKKNDQGKPRMELLPGPALLEVAKVMSFGATKYGDYNWAAGIKYTRVLGAILRHVFSYAAGESTDPETGLSHMAHAACGCLFILFYEKYRAEFDDRYQNDNNKK